MLYISVTLLMESFYIFLCMPAVIGVRMRCMYHCGNLRLVLPAAFLRILA